MSDLHTLEYASETVQLVAQIITVRIRQTWSMLVVRLTSDVAVT